MFIGRILGNGEYRVVFAYNEHPYDKVIKVESEGGKFANILEWEFWQQVQKYPTQSKWFAPCYRIASNGSVLIQARTEPIPESMLPKKIPAFMWDVKPSNWGLWKGRPVCHDYGNFSMVDKNPWKLIKADWF